MQTLTPAQRRRNRQLRPEPALPRHVKLCLAIEYKQREARRFDRKACNILYLVFRALAYSIALVTVVCYTLGLSVSTALQRTALHCNYCSVNDDHKSGACVCVLAVVAVNIEGMCSAR
jgi:hypothetical protein